MPVSPTGAGYVKPLDKLLKELLQVGGSDQQVIITISNGHEIVARSHFQTSGLCVNFVC